jgi:hypothetical protein
MLHQDGGLNKCQKNAHHHIPLQVTGVEATPDTLVSHWTLPLSDIITQHLGGQFPTVMFKHEASRLKNDVIRF